MLAPPLGLGGPEEEQQRKGTSRVGLRPGEAEGLTLSVRELSPWRSRRPHLEMRGVAQSRER